MIHLIRWRLTICPSCFLYPQVEGAQGQLKKLTSCTGRKSHADIKYGIKLCAANIGFNGQFYTFPYFLTFLLRRWLREQD